VYVPSSELGLSHPPPPSRQRVCPSPQNQRGDILACVLGVGGVPIPTTGEKLSALPTLCCTLQRTTFQSRCCFSQVTLRYHNLKCILTFGSHIWRIGTGLSEHLTLSYLSFDNCLQNELREINLSTQQGCSGENQTQGCKQPGALTAFF
jgi:hypothetical protein